MASVSVTLSEAQELHEIIGGFIEAGTWTGYLSTLAVEKLERAREIAALLVGDIIEYESTEV